LSKISTTRNLESKRNLRNMTKQIIFKAGEVAKIDPKKANGGKPLRRSRGEMEYTINKLERKLKIEKRLKKYFLILILLKPIIDSIVKQIIK